MKTTLLAFLALMALIQIVHVHGVQICGYTQSNCPDSSGIGRCCGNINPISGGCCNFGTSEKSVKWFFHSCGTCVGASWRQDGCTPTNLGGVGGGGDYCKTFNGPFPRSASAYDIVHAKLSSLELAYINGTATKPASIGASCQDADQAFYFKDGVKTWITIPQGQLDYVGSLLESKNYTALQNLVVGN